MTILSRYTIAVHDDSSLHDSRPVNYCVYTVLHIYKLFTNAPKYSVSVSAPFLLFITSDTAASTAHT